MNILLVAPHPFFQERGTPIAVKLLIESLSEFGHEIDLLTFNEGADIFVEGLKIYRIPNFAILRNIKIGFSGKKMFADVFITLQMFQLLRRNKYDLIHAVEEAIFPAAFFNKFFKKKLVYDMDSSMSDQLVEKWNGLKKIDKFLDFFERWAVKNSTVVIPVCKYLANKISSYDLSKKIQILEDIAFKPDYANNKKENIKDYFPQGNLIGLYIGNLEHYQGIDLLLEGLSKVKSEIRYSVVIIGGNEKSIKSYSEKNKKLNLEEKVKFLGKRPIDQLPFLLEQADILFSPRTKGKNTPMKIYSYLASGVPVLATNIDSHTQAMNRNQAKFFEPNPESFAEAFVELLENEDERKNIGKAGKKLAEENYSLSSYKKKLKSIYSWLETV